MILGGVSFDALRIVDDHSPDNKVLLSTELLLSGDEVHYVQQVNNAGKIVIEAFDTYAVYSQLKALADAGEPLVLDTGTSQISVIFDYRENPCLKWKDSKKSTTTPANYEDIFTLNLKAL
jgi:hypothetical protein